MDMLDTMELQTLETLETGRSPNGVSTASRRQRS
jgi:hypothetical protein